ncbi:NADH-quinone oxidoreductase subunit N [Buchnera aphidicola (Chaitoregma tattakana)]|uniref:NADH-quinone oxidoreductase subunit N n=1 Tax=Buchnera aphidicola TaxID=9 RepID=UPI0031B80CB8
MLSIIFKYIEFCPFIIMMLSISFGIFFIICKRNSLIMFLNTFFGILLTSYYILFFRVKLVSVTNFFYHFDKFSIFFSLLILFVGLITSIFAYFYLNKNKPYVEEYYILLLLLVLGSVSLNFAKHMLIFFVSMEMITLSTVGLIYFFKDCKKSIEASLKYMIFSNFSSIFILFGFGIIYFFNGSVEYSNLFLLLGKYNIYEQAVVFVGILMVLFGIFFKMSLFPFHFIFPDIYQVSNPLVLISFSTINKLSFFSFLLYFISTTMILKFSFFYNLIQIFAFLSIFFGNFLAIFQKDIKRLLGYASISQVGYLMIVLLNINYFPFSSENMVLYFLNYVLCNVCIFGSMTIINKNYSGNNTNNVFYNIFYKHSLLFKSLYLSFLSLSGIPLTIGFLNKLYMFSSAIYSKLWYLLAVTTFSSILGMYVYFKILMSLYNYKKHESDIDVENFSYTQKILEVIIFTISITLVLFNFFPCNVFILKNFF